MKKVLLILLFLVSCSGTDSCSDCYDQDYYDKNEQYCNECLDNKAQKEER